MRLTGFSLQLITYSLKYSLKLTKVSKNKFRIDKGVLRANSGLFRFIKEAGIEEAFHKFVLKLNTIFDYCGFHSSSELQLLHGFRSNNQN